MEEDEELNLMIAQYFEKKLLYQNQPWPPENDEELKYSKDRDLDTTYIFPRNENITENYIPIYESIKEYNRNIYPDFYLYAEKNRINIIEKDDFFDIDNEDNHEQFKKYNKLLIQNYYTVISYNYDKNSLDKKELDFYKILDYINDYVNFFYQKEFASYENTITLSERVEIYKKIFSNLFYYEKKNFQDFEFIEDVENDNDHYFASEFEFEFNILQNADVIKIILPSIKLVTDQIQNNFFYKLDEKHFNLRILEFIKIINRNSYIVAFRDERIEEKIKFNFDLNLLAIIFRNLISSRYISTIKKKNGSVNKQATARQILNKFCVKIQYDKDFSLFQELLFEEKFNKRLELIFKFPKKSSLKRNFKILHREDICDVDEYLDDLSIW